MVKVAIIDDTHPSIVYGGTSDDAKWRDYDRVYDDWTNEYNSTYHMSRTNGSNIAFAFRGTRITVHGTIELPGTYGVPISIFNIDEGARTIFNTSGQVPYGNPNETYSHVPFFTSPELTYGEHTILITTYNVDSNRRFIFDYFTVEGVEDEDNGIGNLGNVEGFTIVDDGDARVTYDGNWTSGSRAWNYNQTDHLSPPGVNGSATLTFTGTSIAAYGSINNAGTTGVPLAELILDEGTSQQRVVHYSTDGNFTWRNHLQLAVWNGLPAGQHTLKVIALGDRNPSWWMDYFVYGTPNTNQTALRGYVATGSSSTPPVVTTITSGTHVVTSTIDPGDPDGTSAGSSPSVTGTSPGQRTSKGAIAGGVVGGLLGLALLMFLIIFFLRRRRRRENQNTGPGQIIRAHHSVTPAGVFVDSGSPMSLTPMIHMDPVYDINTGIPTNERRPATEVRHSTAKGRFSAFPLSPTGPGAPNNQTTPPNTNYSPPIISPPPPTAATPSSLSGLASTISSPPPLSDGASTPATSYELQRPRERIRETDAGVRLDHWQRYEEETLPPVYVPYSP